MKSWNNRTKVLAGLIWITVLSLADGNVLAAVVTAGNAFYQVHVEDAQGGVGVGMYTATTGPAHPAGAGLNVLFGGGTPGTTFNTLRSFSTDTDYVQISGSSVTSAVAVVSLDGFGTVTPIGTTGFRTTYVLPGPAVTNGTPDQLTIIQDVNVNGTTFADSTIEVTTTVINNEATSTKVGVRYLWDYQVGSDDGPTFQVNESFCTPIIHEIQYRLPQFDSYRIEDNDVNPTSPTFDIFGTANVSTNVMPQPTQPTKLDYVSWPGAFATVFDYVVDSTLVVAEEGGVNDSAVLYYFGNNSANAATIPAGGSNTVSASMFLTPPPPPTPPGPCITRNAQYWFTHPFTNDSTCATLMMAIQANCDGGLDLGFISLPTLPRYGNSIDAAYNATIESLGFYWRGFKRTGEDEGRQTLGLSGSGLCRARKELGRELIAAIANNVLLGTDPSTCTYVSGTSVTNFPPDIIALGRIAGAGENVEAIRQMTVLLQKFNNSGTAADMPVGLRDDCGAWDKKTLKSLSRDPTRQNTCPGINDNCTTAEAVVFPIKIDPIFHIPIEQPAFKASVDLRKYANDFLSGVGSGTVAVCGIGGKDAVWKILPSVGRADRQFTVSTAGSNSGNLLSIFKGSDCSSNGLSTVGCAISGIASYEADISFNTDGTNTFYIVVDGKASTVGKIKLKVTSP